MRVYPTGARVYIAQARGPEGPRRVAVGRHGVIHAEEARKRAALIIARVKAGETPVPEPMKQACGPTVAEVAARYLTEYVSVRCKPSTAAATRSVLEKHVTPALGKLPLAAVERAYAGWRERDWGGEEFVYLWADGIYVNVRNEDRRCLLVVVGCDVRGYKHFLALDAGFRESKESWKAVLLSLRDRGVKAAKLAVGDGGLGFWSALAEVYPETRAQRCRVHKTANVLDKLPKRIHGEAKSMLHEIWRL